ncbi:sulfatase family protein [Roseimaritima sediminicola]|uniref:sulfatase family protein n=1 Tax=Roseimaritima sediminicola TaxID=2662066 RepID=UPI00129853B5|nr:sulfatase [Roseimaritima sediminicola]
MSKAMTVAVAVLGAVLWSDSVVRADQPPNIVLAFADDLGRYASAYADPDHPSPNDVIDTPHFDRVAREGTLFDCALVSAPSCTPSRAALVAGRHFFRNGSHAQLHHPWMKGYRDPWDDVKGFPLILQDAGYHIGWSYKMHISEDRMGGKQRNYRPAGSKFNRFSQVVMEADDRDAAKQRLLDEVRKNFSAMLDDRDGEQPFFYWFNPTNTHRAWAKGSGQALWGIDPDQLQGRLPAFLPDVPEVREDFADYLGEAMAFDAAVGVLWDELQQRGMLDNTLLVVSGDHGAPGFPRGKCNLYDFGTQVPLAIRWPQKVAAGRRIAAPVSLIDLAPTFLSAAEKPVPADMNGQDLWPALRPDAQDYEAALRGWVVCGRENHVNEARPGGLPYPMRALRTEDYLYVVNFAPDRWPVAQPPLAARLKGSKPGADRRMDIDYGPTRTYFEQHETSPSIAAAWRLGFARRSSEELYDVRRDPDQMHNLADDPDYGDVRAELRSRLLERLAENEDPRLDGDAFDHPPYAPLAPDRGVLAADQDGRSPAND